MIGVQWYAGDGKSLSAESDHGSGEDEDNGGSDGGNHLISSECKRSDEVVKLPALASPECKTERGDSGGNDEVVKLPSPASPECKTERGDSGGSDKVEKLPL